MGIRPTSLSDREQATLAECWRRSGGKAWEPRGGTNTLSVRKYVEAGYLKVVNGRCGFELLKDAMVDWTEAGRTAFHQRESAGESSERSAPPYSPLEERDR